MLRKTYIPLYPLVVTMEKEFYVQTIKVDPQGRIVLPKEVRDELKIKPNKRLLLKAYKNGMITLELMEK